MVAYIALLRKDRASDYGVEFPDFPGCVTAGRCDGSLPAHMSPPYIIAPITRSAINTPFQPNLPATAKMLPRGSPPPANARWGPSARRSSTLLL